MCINGIMCILFPPPRPMKAYHDFHIRNFPEKNERSLGVIRTPETVFSLYVHHGHSNSISADYGRVVMVHIFTRWAGSTLCGV